MTDSNKPEAARRPTATRCRPASGASLGALLLLAASVSPDPALNAASALSGFVTRQGDQLREGDRPFRFVSFNIPNLHLVEDHLAFDQPNPWRWPDRFEIADALESTRQAGGTAVRTYVLSVVRTNEGPEVPRHVLGPGRFNEAGFRTLDLVLQVANETGVRVIVPFVDNWSWWGGAAEYAGFRGKPKSAFWSDPEVMADFKRTVRHVLTRTNTLTGVPYRDDPAILGWETGNEVESPPAWTREVAAYIKQLDPRHLVIDGYHSTVLREESLAMAEVDVVTTHHYPGGSKSYAELVRENWAKAQGRKPYFVGEFGFVETAAVERCLDAVQETGTAGALVWSLRFRSRDGGFYWHSEPAGGDKYKAYHWPGFPTGADYDEAGLLALLSRRAYAIRGLEVPAPSVPGPPRLLPIDNVARIAWQGCVGARHYEVERAPAATGPWTAVAGEVCETRTQYRAAFADSGAARGSWFYRVRAVNDAGRSEPSNVVGPVQVEHRVVVDEMADDTHWHRRAGTLEFRRREARKAKEDIHRLAGEQGSTIVYRLPGTLRSCTIEAFLPQAGTDVRFAVSADDQAYVDLEPTRQAYFVGAGDYGYWTPVRYQVTSAVGRARYLRLEFGGRAEVARIEIQSDDGAE